MPNVSEKIKRYWMLPTVFATFLGALVTIITSWERLGLPMIATTHYTDGKFEELRESVIDTAEDTRRDFASYVITLRRLDDTNETIVDLNTVLKSMSQENEERDRLESRLESLVENRDRLEGVLDNIIKSYDENENDD